MKYTEIIYKTYFAYVPENRGALSLLTYLPFKCLDCQEGVGFPTLAKVYDYDAMEKVNHFMKNFNIQSMVLFSNSTFSSKGWGACVMG